jgi:AraC-like DNA-binding protein
MGDRNGMGAFFRVSPGLRGHVQFGLVLPRWQPENTHSVKRLPTARATIYYAADVKRVPALGHLETGVFCQGPRARAVEVSASCGEVVAFKVKSGALRALIGVPASNTHDQIVDLQDLCGQSARTLAERMGDAPSSRERVRILDEWLVSRLRECEDDDGLAVQLAGIAERAHGRTHVADLVERSGYSRRGLIQKFHDCVGLAPKECLRIFRVRSSVGRAADEPALTWAELAARSGYCDQSHMIHEFSDLLGRSPREFIERRAAFRLAGYPASGRRNVPRCEQRLYLATGLVTDWVSSSGREIESPKSDDDASASAQIYNPGSIGAD